MLCDECGKRPATVHITKIVNDHRTKLDLCEECAQKYKKQHFSFSFEPTFSIHNFLAGLLEDEFDIDIGPGVTVPKTETGLQCDKCGMTFVEFSRNGRLGCGQCYETFREKLKPLLKRVHGNYTHTGKVPKHLGENIRFKRELEDLRRELKNLVAEKV